MKKKGESSLNEKYIKEALKEANKAQKRDEVPIGAVLVSKGKVVARGHNRNIGLNDPTAHAEINVIRKACKRLGNYRLADCKLYVTVEPCPMCAGALVWSRIKEVIFGAYDKKAGACGSVFNIANSKKLNHKIKVTGGILEKECRSLIQNFFRSKR
ncbi:MAG: tRNA adenosine(34) deaminase TadA [Elusimicrobia bacterium]|nr:tRNA adenosine(34) deaminase TadA [Candidatus Liberimonas magnetica]